MELVIQSNDLVKASYNLPLLSKKIFAKAISCLYRQGNSLIVEFNAKDLAHDINDNPNLTRQILSAADCIMHYSVELKEGHEKIVTRIFHYVTINEKTKDVKIEFSKPLEKHLINLKERYTKYYLNNIINLTNKNHIRFYEILKSYEFKGTFPLELDFLMSCLDLAESYKSYPQFKQRFLIPAQKELMLKTDLNFKFKEIKSGRKVTGLQFIIKPSENKEPDPEPVLEEKKTEDENKTQESRQDNQSPAIQEVYEYYMTRFKKDNRYELNQKRKTCIKARLDEGYTVQELKARIDFIKKSDFHAQGGYTDLAEHVFNKTKFQRDFDRIPKPSKKTELPKRPLTQWEIDYKKQLNEEYAEAERKRNICINTPNE